MICVAPTLLFPSQTCCCAFLGDFEILLTWLIFPSVRWLLRVWVPFLLLSSLSGMLVQSLFILSLSLFLCSTQLCQEFLTLVRGLSSSASTQLMFCVSCFTCRCVFLMCLWKKVSMTSYSSTILLCPPQFFFFMELSDWCFIVTALILSILNQFLSWQGFLNFKIEVNYPVDLPYLSWYLISQTK